MDMMCTWLDFLVPTKRESLSSVGDWESYGIYTNFIPGVEKAILQSEFSWDWQEGIK